MDLHMHLTDVFTITILANQTCDHGVVHDLSVEFIFEVKKSSKLSS